MPILKHICIISISILFSSLIFSGNVQCQDEKSEASSKILRPTRIQVVPQGEPLIAQEEGGRKKRRKRKHREQAAVEETQAKEALQEQRPLTCVEKFLIVGVGVTLFLEALLKSIQLYVGNPCNQCR